MKSGLASLFLFGAFVIAFPFSGSAQTPSEGTFEDCLGGFTDGESAWKGAVTSSFDSLCWTQQGKAWAVIDGYDGETEYTMYVYTFKSGKIRRCVTQISAYPPDPQDYYPLHHSTYYISGKDASLWNKYVKNDGCDRVTSLED
jgi:hypothetical protein